MKLRQLLIFFLITLSISGFSQKKLKYSAGRLVLGTYQGQKVNKLYKNVQFKQDGRTMTCDSAYAFVKQKNRFLGFSNVKIRERGGNTITSNTLDYNGVTKLAKFRKNVLLKSSATTLQTEVLDYYLDTKISHFFEGGTLRKDGAILTSTSGIFNDRTEIFHFKGDVVLLKNGDTLLTDTLVYDNKTNIAHLHTYSEILGDGKKLFANKGIYNTETEDARFHEGAKIISSRYIMVGDSVNYNANNENGEAFGNVCIFSIEDSMTIFGDYSYRDEVAGSSIVYGNALLEDVDGTDTLLLTADTLYSLSSATNQDEVRAIGDVSFIHTDVQGTCEYLVYGLSDSTITFIDDPILWNGTNQITADTILVFLVDNEMDHMIANINSFIISEDQPLQYNQIKGRKLTANFELNQLREVVVDGNGESVYYAYDDKKALVGLNKAICSNMNIYLDSNEVQKIKFLKQPDAQFIPPDQIKADEKTLKGFLWKIEDRPKKSSLLDNFDGLNNRRVENAFSPARSNIN